MFKSKKQLKEIIEQYQLSIYALLKKDLAIDEDIRLYLNYSLAIDNTFPMDEDYRFKVLRIMQTINNAEILAAKYELERLN